ncbi:protein lin-9 homolog isoform X2 [Hyla sarda]|uniref:protein lin-9 homolog isoform X2 n=1 Tax=Hyla sarda TaxID=327740 RepID=UPI0024C4259D|nr:protein lin-9 homolog isoform X2 [Hyla sarda]
MKRMKTARAPAATGAEGEDDEEVVQGPDLADVEEGSLSNTWNDKFSPQKTLSWKGGNSPVSELPHRSSKRSKLISEEEDRQINTRSPKRNQKTTMTPQKFTATTTTPVKKASQKIGYRLRNLLKLPKAHKWCIYEWFYSNIDKPLFEGDNDFCVCLKESFPNLKTRKLTRVEWGKIRRLMGKPRRCSAAFFEEERSALEQKRQKIRLLQQRKVADVSQFKDLPDEIPLSLVIGTKVTARLRGMHDGLFTGQIDAVDTQNSTYRVTFDRNGLGTHTIPDYEVLSNEPHETMPIAAFGQKQRPSRMYMTPPRLHHPPHVQSPILELDPLLAQSSWKTKSSSSDGDTIGGFPVEFLVQVTRLSKILMVKKEQIKKLKDMNTEAEKLKSYSAPIGIEFQRQYATIVLELEQLNKDLNKVLHKVQQYSSELAQDQGLQPANQPTNMRRRCEEEAQEMVRQANTSSGQPCVQNESLTDLISRLTAILLQIKCLAEGGDLNSFEFKSLTDSINDIKDSINPSNIRSFSAEEAYAFLASDTESASEDDHPFILSSSSSSEEEEPQRRHPGTTTEAAPETSDPTWIPPPENYEPLIPEFTGSSGIKFSVTGLRKIDFFKMFFTDDFIELMVAHTNLYAQRFLVENPTSIYAKLYKWTPVDAVEMVKFWGLLLNMGLSRRPSIRAYWNVDLLYHTPMYWIAMSRIRFESILRFLHYNDNAQCPAQGDPTFDRLFKIRPLLKHFEAQFAKLYTPKKCIAVKESLIQLKEELPFCQSNRERYGIKIFKLCESTSGYTHRFKIHEGTDSGIEPPECPSSLGSSGKVVWDLVHPLLGQGYHLYLDKVFTSVPLFKCLMSRNTVACGTIRKNQRSFPRPLLGQTLRKGESRALSSDHLLYVRYKDKRDVHVLTTIHREGSAVPPQGTTLETPTPDCVLDFKKHMGGFDFSEQVLEPYSDMRSLRVWYKKLAVYVVHMALYNAYVLSQCAGHEGTFMEFQEEIIKTLIFPVKEKKVPSTPSVSVDPRIVPGQHFPSEVPPTGKKGRSQKRCRVCSKRGIRKDTIYQCDTCPVKPGLCMKDCFRVYHTSLVLGDQERDVPSTSLGSEDVARIVPGQHFPSEVPQTGKKGRSQKRCRVCSKKGVRKDTIYQCDTCPVKPGLCMKDCFRVYHSTL